MTTFFVAGIIQGSRREATTHSQSYRERLVGLLRATFPDAEVYCPVEHYPESLSLTEVEQRTTFFALMERAAEADVLVAFVPEASMGTAIEMWQAHRQGRVVVAISPMAVNWAVRFLATVLLPDIEAFEQYVRTGGLARLLDARGLYPAPGGKGKGGQDG
ncbi:MAG: hypothetical protein ACOC8D_01985 [bacterium]